MSELLEYLNRCASAPFFEASGMLTFEFDGEGEAAAARLRPTPALESYLDRLNFEADGMPLDADWLSRLYRSLPSSALDDDDDEYQPPDVSCSKAAATDVERSPLRQMFDAAVRVALRGYAELRVLDGAQGHQGAGNTARDSVVAALNDALVALSQCPVAVVAQLHHHGIDVVETSETLARMSKQWRDLPRSRGGRPRSSARTWLVRRLALIWHRSVYTTVMIDGTLLLPEWEPSLDGTSEPEQLRREPCSGFACSEDDQILIGLAIIERLDRDRVDFVHAVCQLVERDIQVETVRRELALIKRAEGDSLWQQEVSPFDFFKRYSAVDSPYRAADAPEPEPASLPRFDQAVLDEFFWERVEALLPPLKAGGRPRSETRRVIAAVLEREVLGCKWTDVEAEDLPARKLRAYASRWRRPGSSTNGPLLPALVELYDRCSERSAAPCAS